MNNLYTVKRRSPEAGRSRPRSAPGNPAALQRLRITFSRGDAAKYCSHLDLMRLWERAIRRAGLPVAYSEGFTPHPRIALAAPLPVGITSTGELMEIFLRKRVTPRFFLQHIEPQLPEGLAISRVEEAAIGLPSLQSVMRQAEYRVDVECLIDQPELESRIQALLEKDHIPVERHRPGASKSLDLRALVDRLWVEQVKAGACVLGMALRTDSQGSGRPEEVVTVLGLGQPLRMERIRLVLEGT